MTTRPRRRLEEEARGGGLIAHDCPRLKLRACMCQCGMVCRVMGADADQRIVKTRTTQEQDGVWLSGMDRSAKEKGKGPKPDEEESPRARLPAHSDTSKGAQRRGPIRRAGHNAPRGRGEAAKKLGARWVDIGPNRNSPENDHLFVFSFAFLIGRHERRRHFSQRQTLYHGPSALQSCICIEYNRHEVRVRGAARAVHTRY